MFLSNSRPRGDDRDDRDNWGRDNRRVGGERDNNNREPQQQEQHDQNNGTAVVTEDEEKRLGERMPKYKAPEGLVSWDDAASNQWMGNHINEIYIWLSFQNLSVSNKFAAFLNVDGDEGVEEG